MVRTTKSTEDVFQALKSSNSERLSTSSKIHHGTLSSLGDAYGVALLLGNHAKFGLAERCCYHFDLIETLTSLPTERAQHARQRERDRADSVSSHDGGLNSNPLARKETTDKNNAQEQLAEVQESSVAHKSCYCGVVSLLECVPSNPGDSRPSKRALRSKHREFNSRAQKSWGRAHRGSGGAAQQKHSKSASNIGEGHDSSSGSLLRHCHQPRHLPLPLNPSTRVTFAYELTSIAIIIDASPSTTAAATFLEHGNEAIDGCCVPLDRLESILKAYLKGLVQPIEVPPVSVSGLGIAFGRWTPNLAITVAAAYPPTHHGDCESAGLLVRDFRVVDEKSAFELVNHVKRWALHDVEEVIANRLSGVKSQLDNGLGGRSSQGSDSMNTHLAVTSRVNSWTTIRSSMKHILSIGDAALATLPPEGRPIILVFSDCLNVSCGGVFDYLAETSRSDVPINVINLSKPTTGDRLAHNIYSSFPLDVSDDSKSIADACNQSGGIFMDSTVLNSYATKVAGFSDCVSSPFYTDVHFTSKKRSIRPNALQWYTLFSLSPLTPGYPSTTSAHSMNLQRGSTKTKLHQSQDSLNSFGGMTKYLSQQSFEKPKTVLPTSNKDASFSTQAAALNERTFFVKYNINPVRVKSLLMSRILEGYRARRYGQNTQDPDKVSVHMTLQLAECGVVLHYEVSFVSSPYYVPTVGTAHIKLELSGDDVDFISLVKRKFISHLGQESTMHKGRSVSAVSIKAAERICKLLRWIRKEDYLDSYLCLPGWGDIDYFGREHSFPRRLETLTMLQRHRHFRSELLEVVTVDHSNHNNQTGAYALFSDLMEVDEGENNLFGAISGWATGSIVERKTFYKILPPKKEDLAYYLVLRVNRCPEASRLFTVTMDFHGELDAEERLCVVTSFRDTIASYGSNLVILQKKISSTIAVRPESRQSRWSPKIGEYFLHHRSWSIVKDSEVLALITKRRSLVGNFMILHSEENRAIFAKFVNNDAVIYQVLSRSDGVFVDLHMESNPTMFNPFTSKMSAFRAIYEKVKKKDMECAKNLHARTNLLQALDNCAEYKLSQADDILRLISISTRTDRRLRFFKSTSSANNILYELTSKFMTSGCLKCQTAKLSIEQNSVGSFLGTWYIMRNDWYVLSAIHFSTNQLQEGSSELIFFTAEIATLYPSDAPTDVVADDDDPYGLDILLHEIEQAHGKNHAIALYQSLREPDSAATDATDDDIAYALSYCSFQTVLEEFIALDDLSDQLSCDVETMTGIKLHDRIAALLSPLPGSNCEVFYYCGDDPIDCVDLDESNIAAVEPRFSSSAEIEQSRLSKISSDGESDVISQDGESHSTAEQCPLFFKISLDKNAASLQHIRAVKKSTTLGAHISILDKTKALPPIHLAVISKLKKSLNSFAIDQQLEKLRFFGESLSQEDLQNVARMIPLTKHLSAEVPLSFFVSKTKCMVSATNPTGSTENDLEHAYLSLLTQLEMNCTLRASSTSFLALEGTVTSQVIPYWCFVQVVRSLGIIVIKVSHPSGVNAAKMAIEKAKTLISLTCHHTNQLLLLEDLYKTKSACSLLIAEDDGSLRHQDSIDLKSATEPVFCCPIQYFCKMDLSSRCTPRQAIDSLISSTLQNFLLTNRRRMFVYKDEDSNIFYMDLSENEHTVELSVYGLSNPGPSITEQLLCLLQKNMLMLSLNVISSLLMKNPYYALLEEDVAFIRGFSKQMAKFDCDYDIASAKSRRMYAIPPHIKDPLVVLLLFRRNITGSTFIHHLNENESSECDTYSNILEDDVLHIPPQEFTFFFNSTPISDGQYLSTLTERGRQFSREAGSGIAVIEINLIHQSGSKNVINVDDKRDVIRSSSVSKKDIILKSLSENEAFTSFKIAVDITNTTVDVDILHKWVELSFNQVLATWNIETLIRHRYSIADNLMRATYQRELLSEIMPGLPVLDDVMNIACQLPHPASGTMKRNNMIYAHSLATLTLQMNEMIIGILCQKAKMTTLPGVVFIRCTDTASLVHIKRHPKLKESVHVECDTGKRIKDKSIENPEYISVFGLNQFDQFSVISPTALFFKEAFEVRPTQDTTFTQAITKIKRRYPLMFTRNLVYILRVSRSSRTLMTYNIHPQILANIKHRFAEIDDDASKFDETHRTDLYNKTLWGNHTNKLQPIKPTTATKKPPNNSFPDQVKQETMTVLHDDISSTRGPKRRIPRPTSMIRPKLIGKSVEGSAMHAVAASRLRASSRPLPPQRAVSGSGKSPSTSASQKVKEKNKAKKANSSSTSKDVGKFTSRLLPRAHQTKLIRDILFALVKPTAMNRISPNMDQTSMQSMLYNFLLMIGKKDNQVQVQLIHAFANCYGNYLGSWSVEQLKCDQDESVSLLFLRQALKYLSAKNAVPIGKSSSLPDTIKSPLFLAKNIASNALYKATLLIQLSIVWDNFKKIYMLTCKTWLFVSTSAPEIKRDKAHVPQNMLNRESSAIQSLTEEYISILNFESEILNFACRRLSNIAQRTNSGDEIICALPLLRAAITRFDECNRYDGIDYHLQRRFLASESFLGDLPYKKAAICSYLETHCNKYHLSQCNGTSGQSCFAGNIKVLGFIVHFFIGWHETVETAFDVFVLTETKGQQMDLYIAKKGSPYAEKLSHVILHSTMCTIQELLIKTALDSRQQHLWNVFGKNYSQSPPNNDELLGMIGASHKVEMSTVDERVETLFNDDLHVSWHELFLQIHNFPPFSHCIAFETVDASYYVVYIASRDVFLFFKRSHQLFEEKFILTLDPEVSSVGIVEQFINRVAKSLFDASCQFSVT